MTHSTDTQPGAPQQDNLAQLAPDPRAQYDSPESLAGDATLDIRQREVLLLEWRYDLEQRLIAVSEGMSASTPDRIPDQTTLAAELRRVTQAWEGVTDEAKRLTSANRAAHA